MVFWIALALLTGAAVFAVLWPLSVRPQALAGATGSSPDVAFYRAQLAEIDRDRDRGLIGEEEASDARLESSRRLLRAADGAPPRADLFSEPALRRRRAASALVLSVVPIVGLALYGALGSPQLPDQPAASRIAAPGLPAEAASALARIEQHLAAEPNDLRGWEVVAPIYVRVGRYDDAVRAFANARRIGGPTAERLNGEGEARVLAARGTVGPEARALFQQCLALAPGSPEARYYLAIAAEQDGNVADASERYRSLVADAPPDAPWAPLVRQRLARLGTGEAPAADGPASLPADAVTPEIAGMVAGLDERLLRAGGTEAEWSRLIRSLAVIGRRDDAVDRLARARASMAADPAARERLEALAAGLGLRPAIAGR